MCETILVTGAAGFIGSHLSASLLARGARVIGVDNFDPFYERAVKNANLQRIAAAGAHDDSRFECIELDIRDAQRMRTVFERHRPVGVFHLAALAGVRPSIADPSRFTSVNLDGTVSVLEAARSADCRNVVFASSSSVYGNNRKAPFAEDDPVDEPISPYAATKRAGELICHTYAHLFSKRIAALRFFTVYGPGQRPDLAIASFMRRIASGEDIPMFGDGTTSRDYTYIDDIVAGVLSAWNVVRAPPRVDRPGEMANGGFFRIYNLGGSHPMTLADLIDAIANVVGRSAHIKHMPVQAGDVDRTWADLARSNLELHYHPSVTFERGLQRQWDAMHPKPSIVHA